MMNRIMANPVIMPDYLLADVEKDSIPSYNAGVIGGNDLNFIKKYCQAAFDFININRLNDVNNKAISVNYNILFEQILFCSLSEKMNKTVSTVINLSINDKGYTYTDFCNFYSFDKYDLMHIIGGHKRNKRVCELLSRTLLNKYPEYYKKIVELFTEEHTRLSSNNEKNASVTHIEKEEPMSPYNIEDYESRLNTLSLQWKNISNKELFNLEEKSCNYFQFLNSPKEDRLTTVLKKNPYLSIYDIPDNWSSETKQYIKERIFEKFDKEKFDIVLIPELLYKGYKEVLIDDICYNILSLLHEEKTLNQLLDDLKPTFPLKLRDYETHIYNVAIKALEYLFYNKLIYID